MGRYDRRRNRDNDSSFGSLVVFGVVLGAGIYLLTREQNRRAIDAKLAELGLKDTVDELGSSVAKGWEQTKQAAAGGGTLSEKVANVKDAAATAAKDVADTAKDNQADVQAAGKQLKADAQDAVADAQDKAADLADQAKTKGEELKGKAEDAADDAKKAVAKGTEDAKAKAEDLKDAAQVKAEEVKDAAQQKADQAKDKADQVAKDVKDTAKEASDTAQANKDSKPEWPYSREGGVADNKGDSDKSNERKF